MNTPLYEIADEYINALHGLSDIDLPPECVADTLEGLQGELTDKLRAVIAYAQTLDAEAGMYSERAGKISERAKATAKRAESLRSYALLHMTQAGLTEIKSADFTARPRINPPSVVIDDESLVSTDYWRVIPASECIDKRLIAAAFKDGYAVEGAHVERTIRLEVK